MLTVELGGSVPVVLLPRAYCLALGLAASEVALLFIDQNRIQKSQAQRNNLW